jgi:ElaB/YqjD/DUF883 family membrane-anchored ribosome-binding protein
MEPTTTVFDDMQRGGARVADAVSDFSATAGQQAKKVVQDAADDVRDASDYVRESGGEVVAQITKYLKANPSHALVGAAIVGFVLGRFVSRD